MLQTLRIYIYYHGWHDCTTSHISTYRISALFYLSICFGSASFVGHDDWLGTHTHIHTHAYINCDGPRPFQIVDIMCTRCLTAHCAHTIINNNSIMYVDAVIVCQLRPDFISVRQTNSPRSYMYKATQRPQTANNNNTCTRIYEHKWQ